MDNAFSEMVDFIRKQGAALNPGTIQLAEMTGAKSCRIGKELALTAQDLIIPDRLLTSVCTKVAGTCPADGGALTDKSSYNGPLKAGDIVAIYKLNDSKYLILDRVVMS